MRKIILQTVLCLGFIGLCRAEDSHLKPCDSSLCPEGHLCFENLDGDSGSLRCIDEGFRLGNCSLNMINCHDMARCVESDDHSFYTCDCADKDAIGDGFLDGTGCTLPFKPCNDEKECPQYGHCNTKLSHCECNKGFQGDGYTCDDVNECTDKPCDVNAICANVPGSFSCRCDIEKGYVGNGLTCRLFCHSHNDCDWPKARCNDKSQCECMYGYRGDGLTCKDVDECAEGLAKRCNENAACENTMGDYECRCNNGYVGNGKTCRALATSCDDIPKRRNKRYYSIDPDFTGPANAFSVQCLYIRGEWVTSVRPTGHFPLAAPESDQFLNFTYEASPDDIKVLIKKFPFCSQRFSFACDQGFSLFPGTTWYDVNGNIHNNWGSTMGEMCTCGELKQCKNPCYCDGTQTDVTTKDEGRVVDKSQLPMMSIHFAQGQKEKGRVDVDPLMCSSKPIDIPKDCHEAKFEYGHDKDTPLFIDVDGSGGEDPFMVFCDMESYEHVGITQIPMTNDNPIQVTTEQGEIIDYTVDHDKMKALIEGSLFCSQSVEFQCKNSKLLGEDGGAVYVKDEMQKLDYFPGAQGTTGSCGCGATDSCDQPEVKCNCNIDDGQAHKDFGLIIDKSALPVTKVTAQVGGSRSSTYKIGDLRCSQKQFGLEPNCEKYHAIGVRESHTYLIDPDGTGGQDPFSVQCLFVEDPSQGQTIVHHDKEGNMTVSDGFDLTYLMANPGQIEALMSRSTFCTQEITIDCRQFTDPVDPGTISWTGGNNATSILKLSDYLDSCGPTGDACKCGQNGQDTGTITDKSLLPINKMDFSSLQDGFKSGRKLNVDIGPLVCSEVYPTCKQLFKFVNSDRALEGEADLVNGRFTVDPDGGGGVEPFTVECSFPDTVIDATGTGKIGPKRNDPVETISECFDVSYTSATGQPLTPDQVAAYAAAAGSCSQSLSLRCKKAPATKMVNFTTCDGITQVGWAGSYGQDSCACGVNGNCEGGRHALCNCDRAANKWNDDAGVITQAERLPVCQVCLSIAPPTNNARGWTNPLPELRFSVGDLVCDRPRTRVGSCQEARRRARVRGNVMEVPQVLSVGRSGPSVPVGCRMYREPPHSAMVVKPNNPKHQPQKGDTMNVTLNYITIDLNITGQVMSDQKFCSQKIFIYCAQNDYGTLSGKSAWYDRHGNANHEWTRLGSQDMDHNCKANQKLCNRCGNPQGYLVELKDLLPVTRLVLEGSRIGVMVEDAECLDLLKSCQEIYDKNERNTGYFGKNRYMIDVDQAGPLRPFRVLCEFDKRTDNGITVVAVGGEWESTVPIKGQGDETGDFVVEYEYASPEQINRLANISDFCWQGVQFKCQNFPLLEDTTHPSTYYKLYNEDVSSSFGTGQDVDFQGCACHKLDFCYTALACNCDANRISMDQGAVTHRASLPVTGVHIAKQDNPDAEAVFNVGSVRCSAKSTALPRDCAEALKLGSKDGVEYHQSGEYLISPNPGVVEPFMVRCDFTKFPGKGVTVFRPHMSVETPLPTESPDTSTEVPYHGADKAQIKELVKRSAYCYQGVRFDCFNTSLLSGGSYFQSPGSSQKWSFWGGGKPGTNGATGTCACGDNEACAGLDSSAGQRTRPCNCDALGAEHRKDAGIIYQRDALPITGFHLGAVYDRSQASLTVGDLFCSQEPLSLNECELNFHDCDPRADCHDMEDGYQCVCPDGWQGKGVVTDPSQARANGRVCIDDDECEALYPCSYNADCTNLPGTFECTCKEGYRAISQTECEDVDECVEGTHDCGENAFCDNLIGTYRCICNKGFRGDGKECFPIGQCTCFGDPHCNSFDKRWLHFMGDCHYVMASDGCGGQPPSFVVEVEEWRKGQPAAEMPFSWVESVKVMVDNKTILMEQGPRLVVDGQLVSNYIDSFRLRVVLANNRIQLKTFSGLEVTWDGNDRVSVVVPEAAMGSTCGLCGNYDGNPDNDWTVGPACPNKQGQTTDNFVLFGNSWAVEDECSADCSDKAPLDPSEECAREPKVLVEEECRKLLDPRRSVFKKCLDAQDPAHLEDMQFSCMFDICASSEKLGAKVCRMAENIARDCAEVEKIPIENWRESVDSCPEYKCSEAQHYLSCGPANPRTCFNMNDPPSGQQEACVEGCFCPLGTLTEGESCIKEEQCGCFYESSYLPTGGRMILEDCSAEINCEGSNFTTIGPVMCGVKEKCMSVAGVTDCHCLQGYVKINGTCIDENCVGIHCGENMECRNGTCFCLDGYYDECGRCVDIDECKNNQHECTGLGEICVNKPGSYVCDCEAGFKMDGEQCQDVDECETIHDACGEYSKCVNTPGGYVCECCAGYKHGPNAFCVRDQTQELVGSGDDWRCCACQGMRCTKPGKVCGTDGNTYVSYRALSIHACRVRDINLKLNYIGQCQGLCDDVYCDRNYQVCEEDEDGIPQCMCPTCGPGASTGPVCGTDGKTYRGVCSLKQEACENQYQGIIRVEHREACQDKKIKTK